MKQADSFIQSQEQSNLVSPIIQATLKANWYQASGSTRAANELYVLGDATIFNGHLIYSTRGSLIVHVDTRLASGYTSIALNNNTTNHDFYINGSTLICRYTYGVGGVSSGYIGELKSNDGYTWGGSDIIFTYSTGDLVIGVDSLGPTNVLMTVPDIGFGSPYAGVYALNKGATWGATLITAEQTHLLTRTKKISALGNTTGLNVVYHEYQDQGSKPNNFRGNSSWVFDYNDQYSVKRFLWDRVNYLPLDDFQPLLSSQINKQSPGINQFHISSITKGQTNYYMVVSMDNAQNLSSLSGQSVLSMSSDTFLLSSPNGLDWSSGIFVANTIGGYNSAQIPTSTEYTPVVVCGQTNNQDVVKILINNTMSAQLGYGLTPIMIIEKNYTFGATTIDITDNLTMYSNNNNQRITLGINNNV